MRMGYRRTKAAVGLAVGATLAATAAAPAWGSTGSGSPVAPTVTEIASGLQGPLQIDVQAPGRVFTGQTATGTLTRISLDGKTKDLVTAHGEIAGVAARGKGVAFTFTGGTKKDPKSQLRWLNAQGEVEKVANLRAFEERNNPDHRNRYGFLDLSAACARKVPQQIGGKPYRGQVDSHPYAIANTRHGWLVADAGGNDILRVKRDGSVSVVAVLRPQRLEVTTDIATSLSLPACTVGKVYAFEPVPTDVEHLGRSLVVSLLPGGPEDPSLGARGSVVRVDRHGASHVLATGVAGAVNVAVSARGPIFVAELFANRISKVDRSTHTVTPYVDLNQPGGLDYWDGELFATRDVLGSDGSLVSITG
jgi:hypothetical protein